MTLRAAALLVLSVVLVACGSGAAAAPMSTQAGTPAPRTQPSGRDARASAPAPVPSGVAGAGARAELLAPNAVVGRAPQPTAVATTRRAGTGAVADYCIDRDVAAAPTSNVELTVLDRTHILPHGYAPPDLVSASAAGYTGSQGGKLISGAIVDDLAALRRDSTAAGLQIQLQSTYRSYASQLGTFNHWVAVFGMSGALQRSARPGHSEHQLGTTIDFTSPGWGGRFGNWATQTREGAWLAANGWRYGFVMSYPLGSQATTCFSYEPWHYRWIGRAPAAAWHASGQLLHAFLASLGQ